MHPLDFPLLIDENVAPSVIDYLVAQGSNAASVVDRGLVGHRDVDLLALAFGEGRVVLTHDADFGTLAIRSGEPLIGIVYLRPGHIQPNEVVRQIEALRSLEMDASPPFIVVAERRGDDMRVRLRRLR